MDVTCITNNFNPYMEAKLLFRSDLILSLILEIKLISTLTLHTLICSCHLDVEMETIHSIFRNNGYPENVFKCTIEQRVKHFKYPTYVWSQVVSGACDICCGWVMSCFPTVGTRVNLKLSPRFLHWQKLVCCME